MAAYQNLDKHLIRRAHYNHSDFFTVFGKLDGAVTSTHLNTKATMQQVLTLANSEECKEVTDENSYLMKAAYAKEKLSDRVQFLYYSIYGRAPLKNEVSLAMSYCKDLKDKKRWANYVLALLNSPEFYFIK